MEKSLKRKSHKGLKITLITIGSLVGALVVGACSYVAYCGIQFYRIPDNLKLDVDKKVTKKVELNKELTFTSLNIGFGAYSDNFSFFMDYGINEDGKETQGVYSRAFSSEESLKNTRGCIDSVKKIDSDFIAFQEVDPDGDRSQHVDQVKEISKAFKDGYDQTFCYNYHSAWFLYPVHKPIGAAKSGLQTVSKYQMSDALRKQYVITDNFFDKMFDLDRCFAVHYLPINNSDKQLILINSHMSAYDEGGQIRNKQVKQLNDFMKAETAKGNYVVCGGDFNHDLLTFNPNFNYNLDSNTPFKGRFTQQVPTWICPLFDIEGNMGFDDEFKVYAADDEPTCRGADVAYESGVTYLTTVDGFICSSNVEVINTTTTKLNSDRADMFAYSDHQPTTLTFKLN